MKKDKVQKKFLEELENTPIIQHACVKCGISRNTYYRWCKEDPMFKILSEERIGIGVDLVNDVAENNLLQAIKRGEYQSTIYWLSHRNENYRKPLRIVTSHIEEILHEKRIEVARKRAKEMQDRWIKNVDSKDGDKSSPSK